MSKTNNPNPTWQCPICLDIRYETIKSEKVNTEGGAIIFVGRQHYCKGCGVLFRDPYLFNKVRLDNGNKHHPTTEKPIMVSH